MNNILFPFGDPQGDQTIDSVRTALERNAAAFWRGQAGMLEVMQEFANGWFARRQAGAQAAMESAQRLCLARNPTEAANEVQGWMRGSMDRLMADAMALQRQAAAGAGLAASAKAGMEEAEQAFQTPRSNGGSKGREARA
jgi:hypothetical protein